MYIGRDYSPAEQVESRVFGLDFINDIDAGDTLNSTTWALTVALASEGQDPAPSAHLIGVPTLVTPIGTTAQTATQQRIAGLLPNVTYTARAIVTTTGGAIVSLWAHIFGEDVG